MNNQGRGGGKGGPYSSGSKSKSGQKSGGSNSRRSPKNDQRNSQDKARQVSSPENREASGSHTPSFNNNSGNRSKPNNDIRERVKGQISSLQASVSSESSSSTSQPHIVKSESGIFTCVPDAVDSNESPRSDSETNAEKWAGRRQERDRYLNKKLSIKEIEGNLFNAPDNVSLVHCVGADLRMGSGIALEFHERFKSLGKLFDQRVGPGGVAFIRSDDRYVFYLITKQASTDKPTIDTMNQSLLALHEKCKEFNVTELAMPRIGCGIDGLSWSDVKQMLEGIFAADGFNVTIYNWDRGFVNKPIAGSKSMVRNENLMLKDIDRGTGLLYIGCAENFVTEEMKSLNINYPFLQRLHKRSPPLGTASYTRLPTDDIVYGLICKETARSPLSYEQLEASIRHLKEHNKKHKFEYFGIQAFVEKDDPHVMEKIETLFKNSYIRTEFWICWPPSLIHMRPSSAVENDKAMQVQESSSAEDHRSDIPSPPDNRINDGCSPQAKSKWEDTGRNRQSRDNSVREVEAKMNAQSLADQSKSGISTFDPNGSDDPIDAIGNIEMEVSVDNTSVNIPEHVDNSNNVEEEDWSEDWTDHAEAEKRRSFEKKEAIRQEKEKERQGRKSVKPKSCVTECKGDLFDAEDTMCLAHCVGADFRMGSGIAVLFRQKFGSVAELLDQRVRQGGVAVIQHENRHIFYLVTKKESTGKPTYDSLESSLHALHKKCKELKVTELAMPRIGCGLDRLEWDKVKEMLEDIFADGFTIKIYNLEKEYKETKQSMPKTTIKNEVLHLKDIQLGTGLLYIGNVEQVITEEMKSLGEKYSFLQRLDKAKPKLGTVVRTESSYPREVVYGLICRQSPNDPLSFNHLRAALKQLRKLNVTDNYKYFGIQASRERGDDNIMGKIETMLRYSYIEAEAWICFPPSLTDLMSKSSSPTCSPNTSGRGRSSCGEVDNQRIFSMLRDMQRTQESTYRKLISFDDMSYEINGPKGLKEMAEQTTAQMIEFRKCMDETSAKTNQIIQELRSSHESQENLRGRVTALETINHDLAERIEFLEQQRLPSSSPGHSFNMNGSYSHVAFPDGPVPLLQDPTMQQVCPSPSDYYLRRMQMIPALYPTNRQIYASELLPAEKDALTRAAKGFARANHYELSFDIEGSILMRKDKRHQWIRIDSHGDLHSFSGSRA